MNLKPKFYCIKQITMVLHETMWLYPPISFLTRHAIKDTKHRSINIMTRINLMMIAIHHDTKIWGSDANEFNPFRFSKPRNVEIS